MTRAVLIATVLLSGCYSAFSLPDCIERCEACEIVDCDPFCASVEAAIESDACHVGGVEMWHCVERIGCDFPLQCREEYSALAACEAP